MVKKSEFFLWIFLILIIFFRYFTTRPIYRDGDKIKITSKVTTEPQKFERSQYLRLKGLKVYLPLYPEINYGDTIIISGKVNLPKKTLKEGKLIKLENTDNFLTEFRQGLIQFYQSYLPEPHASLIAGLVLGSKSSLPNDFWLKLKYTGTAHVVVASGMNVSLIAGFLVSLLIIFLPRTHAVIFSAAGIWLYALLVGFEAPIVRASLMGTIAFTAVTLGRVNFALRSLLLTAALMLFVNPDWLGDLGFILSFAATFSLLIFEAKIRKFIRFVPSIFREGLSTSLAAQVGVFPILYYMFGYINPASPFINALVLWTVPIITIVGLTSGFVGVIFEPFGKLILYLAYPLTSWFIWIVDLFG